MNANGKYLNFLEGYLRKTIDTAVEKAFKDLQIDGGDIKRTLMSLIDGYIRNQLDILEGKQR